MILFGMFSALYSIKSETIDIFIEGIVVFLFGLISACVGIVSFFFNKNAYLLIENQKLSAQFNWKKRISCDIRDIEYVSVHYKTLTFMLYSKKRYSIYGLDNAYQICDTLRKMMGNSSSSKDIRIRISEFYHNKKSRKYDIILTTIGLIFMISGVFIVILLIGDKEISQFDLRDVIIFFCFIALETIILTITFVYAFRAGDKKLYLIQKEYELNRMIMQSEVPTDKSIEVLNSFDFDYQIVIFKTDDEKGFGYSVWKITDDWQADCILTSDKFFSLDDLHEEIKEKFGELIFSMND